MLLPFHIIEKSRKLIMFLPKKALILRKFSKLDYQKLCNPHLKEEQLNEYAFLKHYDQVQKSCLRQIESALEANNIEFQTVDKFGYTDDKVDWADVIITSGGDGTFLMAASKVTNREKPVIGINSDPTKSVGHLCLPSSYSNHFDKVIDLLKEGKFHWEYKQRLRVTLVGDAAREEPRQLNDIRYDFRDLLEHHQHNATHKSEDAGQHETTTAQQINSVPSSQTPNVSHNSNSPSFPTTNSVSDPYRTVDGKLIHGTRQLKERALNEVFVGETLSARVSYYELSIDNNRMIKMKSSGLTVCTGTGSTSWYYNINKLTEQQVHSLVSIMNMVNKKSSSSATKSEITSSSSSSSPTATISIDHNDPELINQITQQFNQTLTFPPTEPIMAYSIREPVNYASTLTYNHRGRAKRVEVKSRMQNACLVLDGCQFYPFNDGSYALIEMFDEDALKTVSLEHSHASSSVESDYSQEQTHK